MLRRTSVPPIHLCFARPFAWSSPFMFQGPLASAVPRYQKCLRAASTTITCMWRNRYNELLGCTLLLEHTYTLYNSRGPLYLRPRDQKSRYTTPHLTGEFAITVLRVASLCDARDEGVSREWYSGRDAPVSMLDSLGKLVAHRVGYSSAMVHRK